jgi:hypothetical protein
MKKQRQLVWALAAFGLVITAVSWAYNAFGDYSRPMNIKKFSLTSVLVILCPPSLLSVPFWETEPDTVPGVVIWSIIGLINSGLYAAIGTVVGRRLWKSDKTAPPGS